MVALGFPFTRPSTVVAGVAGVSLGAATLVSADEPWSTLTAEVITSSVELVVNALEVLSEVDAELLVEALVEVSISVEDDVPVEEVFEALSEGTTAELIGSSAELSTVELVAESSELVTVESVDGAYEDPTEVDDALLVEG